jgi:cytochrome c-type biogenesis protein CcsB
VPVNIGLADVSSFCLLAALVIYAIAMLCYACDFAFARRRLAMPEPAGKRELVAAAAPAAAVGAGSASAVPGAAAAGPGAADPGACGQAVRPAATGPAQAGSGRSLAKGGWLRTAFLLTCGGLVLHIIGIVSRGISEHRVPWGNMYEFVAAITCMAVIVLVLVSVRYHAYYIGLFVLVPVVLALALAVTVIYTPAGALVPALQSYWIAIHVTSMIVATGLYIVGIVVTVMYLMVDRYQRRTASGLPSRIVGIIEYLPGAKVLDQLSYRTILFAFPVWTFGIIAGAIWADQAWGRYWGWDPKETWSFITWVVYAGFLHARATAGWRGRRAAYIQVAGFCCLMFNLVGVNLWITGLHSYAGLS